MTYLRVKELAEARGWNIMRLSHKAELAYSTTHALWQGDVKQLNMKTLDRVADALGVNVSDLFGGKPEVEKGNSAPMRLAA